MKKLKLLFAACTLLFGATANAQTDVTASYIGNVDRIIQGGGHNCSANKHVLSKAGGSQGEGYFNTQDLGNGWHNFVANTANVTNGVESWTGSAGSEGWILGRVMVLPQGQYTLKFTAMSTNQSGTLTNTVVKCGNEEKAFVGQGTYNEYSFDIDVTTANTPYEFGIYQKSGGTGNWSVMGGISLTLNSTNVFPVDNSSVDYFDYSGNQTWHTNTWSIEGNTDGSKFLTPFHELWVSSGNTLDNATIKGTYTPTVTGVYKVSAWVRAMNEAGGAVTGAKIFVGDAEADACSGSVVYSGKGRLGTYTAMADGTANTPFEYGFKLENAEINWLAFKNVTITYLGTMPQEEIEALLALVPTGKMNADIQNELNSLVTTFQENASVANYNALSLYLPTAQASADVYANINTAISNYATKASALDAAGQGAYDDSGIQTKYNNGTYTTLAGAEEELNTALTTAVKAQTTVGSDWTGLIVNPSFETGNLNGWTSNDMGTQNNTAFTLKDGTYYAQSWLPNGTKSISQTLTAMPAGVYHLSAAVIARGVTSAKISAGGVEQTITVSGSANTYNIEFACDENADVTISFEGVGTGADASWLATDNYQLTLVSAGLPDVTAVTGKMNATVAQAQTDAIAVYNAEKTVVNYNAASAAIAAAQTSADAYAAANAAITRAEGIIAETNVYTTAAYNTYKNAIDDAKDAYNDGTMSDADATALETNLNGGSNWKHDGDPMRPFYTSAWTASNGVDIYTNNWSTEGVNDGSNFLTPFIEDFAGNNSNTLANTEISASIPNLAKGTYEVTARVRMRLNDNGTEPLSGLSLKASYGNATAVSGNKNFGAFYVADVTAEGYVTEENGTLNIKFIVDDTNASWISIKSVKYEKTSSSINAPLADADDYAALNAVLDPVKDNVAGFEKDEYAPYNNKEAFAALADAKAINQSGDNLKGWVEEVKEALSVVSWTKNTEELNAFYDGEFSECAEDTQSPLDYAPEGWTASENFRMMLKNSETYPGLTDASATSALFSWTAGVTYGEQTGYEMPLKANTVYTLKLKAAGWENQTRSGISVSILNGTDGMALYNLGTPDCDIKGNDNNTAGMTSYEYVFTTGAAGNYVFHVHSGNNFVITDLEIKKAESQVLEFAENAELPNYAPGTYTVNITRTIKADFNTVVLPFDLDANQVAAAFGANTEVYEYSENSTDANNVTVNFTKNDGSIKANTPVLVKAGEASSLQKFEGLQVVAPTDAVVSGNYFDFVGVYAPIDAIPAGDYFIGNGALYKSEGETNMKAFRAYLKAKEGAEARNISFAINDKATAIEGIEIEGANDGKIYNLKGQEVKNPQKGVYIQNGKIIIIK